MRGRTTKQQHPACPHACAPAPLTAAAVARGFRRGEELILGRYVQGNVRFFFYNDFRDTPSRDFFISGPRAFDLQKTRGRLRLVDMSRTPSGTLFFIFLNKYKNARNRQVRLMSGVG